ncbi:hypothetical protein PG988_002563 [Apiospora saccharicola]
MAIVTQGLDRTVQNQYRERQDQALKPLELQVTRVRAADLEWKTEMTLAKRDVKVLQAATRKTCLGQLQSSATIFLALQYVRALTRSRQLALLQKKLTRKRRELAIKRWQEEETREEAAKHLAALKVHIEESLEERRESQGQHKADYERSNLGEDRDSLDNLKKDDVVTTLRLEGSLQSEKSPEVPLSTLDMVANVAPAPPRACPCQRP